MKKRQTTVDKLTTLADIFENSLHMISHEDLKMFKIANGLITRKLT